MGILSVNNLKKMFGSDTVLQNINFEIQKNDHTGLVGINGSGKTTLFKLLSGEYDSDDGEFFIGKDTTVGYMEQHVCHDEDKTAYTEVLTIFQELIDIETELDELNHRLTHSSQNMDTLIEKQLTLNERFNDLGGLTYKNRAKATLIGLGFAENELNKSIKVLSGGQKGKIQLAKMLLSGANLLLLDEPTNHLDIEATQWLEDFLKTYNGAFIVISHDRYFLDKVCTNMFEIDSKTLHSYKGNYSAFVTQKAENRLARQRVYDNAQKEIKRIEGIIEQQKRFNQERNYITIAHKQKSIDRLEATLDKPESEPDTINFEFHASRRGGNEVLIAENLSLSFKENQIFEKVDLYIRRQEKMFLVGPNGCGKTSLLKLLLGTYESNTGDFRFGSNIDVGYYDQAQDSLDETKTVIDEIWDLHPLMTQTEVRSALAVFLFRGEDVYKPIKGLSGGERARVLLLKLMLQKTNFLILDEPTNHLDISSREALEDALLGYDGTLLVVSHDRYLINKLAEKVLYLDKNGITTYMGNYDDYLAKKEQQKESTVKVVNEKQNDYKLNKERKALIRKNKNALANTEKSIETTEAEIEDIEKQLILPEVSIDYTKSLELSNKMEELRVKCEELMETWEELHLWLEENPE